MVINKFSDIEMQLLFIGGRIVWTDPHEGPTNSDIRGSCKYVAKRVGFLMKS